jgi:hypothetical protein
MEQQALDKNREWDSNHWIKVVHGLGRARRPAGGRWAGEEALAEEGEGLLGVLKEAKMTKVRPMQGLRKHGV